VEIDPVIIGDDGIMEILNAEAAAAEVEQSRQKSLQAEKDHIERWFERVTGAIKHDKFYRDRWSEDRRIVRGEFDTPVSANLVSAILDVLGAFLFAKNPDINVWPSDSVNRKSITQYREFAKTIEIIASRLLKDAKLKRRAKRWIRGAQTVGIGWLKAIMQTTTEKQPLMVNRINDLQDQISNIRAKQTRLTLDQEKESILISEIESNIHALEHKAEITVAEGLVLDYVPPEDVVVAPDCGEVENYLDAPWICFIAYKTEDETLAITGWQTEEETRCLKTANRFRKRPRGGDENDSTEKFVAVDSEQTESDDGFYRFFEIWSLEDGVVYTLIDGCTERWARKKYAPITGRRFYPAFQLGFHYVDGDRYPQSDARQLKKLAEEYNETRSDFRVHRQRARPGTIFNENAIDPESVKKVCDSHIQEYIGVSPIRPEADINQMFAPKRYSAVDQSLYNTDPILRDMEKVSGAQEALQSSVQVEKTATEANIQEAGRGARTGARLDDLEDSLTELCEYIVQLSLLTFDQADAERYAGTDAVWINLTTDQALNLFQIEIKSGSTGKPRAASDRESWAVLMPMLKELIIAVGEARIKGQEWAAKPMIALMEETLNRLDDHADLEMFLPVVPPEAIQESQQPDRVSEAEIQLDQASAIDKAASAVEKMPSLALSPQIREILGFGQDEEVTPEALSGVLSGPQQQEQPSTVPAPSPI